MHCEGEGDGEVAVFRAKRWDRRNRADQIESATPIANCIETKLQWQVVHRILLDRKVMAMKQKCKIFEGRDIGRQRKRKNGYSLG